MISKTDMSKKGFTLVEFIIAIALLGIVASLVIIGSYHLSKITEEIMDDTQQQQMLNTTERIMSDYLSTTYRIDEHIFGKNDEIDLNKIISKSSADYRDLRIIYLDAHTNTLYVYSVIKDNFVVGEGKVYQLLAERKADNILTVDISTDEQINNICVAKYKISFKTSSGNKNVLIENILPLRNFTPKNTVSSADSNNNGETDSNYNDDEPPSKVFVLYYYDM